MDTPTTQTDEHAIHTVVQHAVAAWNAGDGAAYGALFDADADYVTFGGTHTHGRNAIAAEHQDLFDTVLHGSRLQLHITQLRFLAPDIAVVHADGGILDDPHQEQVSPTRRSMQTIVLRKADGDWCIAVSQVTRMQAVQPGVNVPAQEHEP